MKIARNKNFICFLLTASMIFSGLFFHILNSDTILSDNSSNHTDTYYTFSDALPSTAYIKENNSNSSVVSGYKPAHNVLRGFGGIAALACVFNNRFYLSFSSMVSLITCSHLHSHAIVLNYIHQKDGKK